MSKMRFKQGLFLTVVSVAMFALWLAPIFAQETPPTEPAEPPAETAPAEPTPAETTPPVEAEEAKEPGIFGQLWGYYRVGGITMHPMLLLSIASLTVILERAWAYSKARVNPITVVNEVRETLLNKKSVKAALEVCEKHGNRPVPNVIKSALLKFDDAGEEIKTVLENAAVSEVARLEKFLAVLATVATIAPLFGFLGTVTGMIKSFAAIAQYGMTNPNLVAKGISEALITTAFGLFIALFSQPFYNMYSAMTTKFIREMEGTANILLETHTEFHNLRKE